MGNPKGIKRDFEALKRRRLKASKLFRKGLSDAEIARQMKVTRNSVGNWRRIWSAHGAKGLAGAGRAGRKPRLGVEQDKAIVTALKEGASAHGYRSDVWTLPRTAKLVEKITGVRYHPRYMGDILRRLGFSCQRPIVRAKERDEARIQQWVKREWPRIKKKPKKSGES